MADGTETGTKTAQAELHNRMAGEIVKSIVAPVIRSGGGMPQVMVLTESVLVGVALACIRLGGDNRVLDTMVENARLRLAEIRLKDINTGGSA